MSSMYPRAPPRVIRTSRTKPRSCHDALVVSRLISCHDAYDTVFYLGSEYDGGDCCECTCVTTGDFTCGQQMGFACLDPSAPCVDDDSVTFLPTSDEECLANFIADGDCDLPNNTEECGKSFVYTASFLQPGTK